MEPLSLGPVPRRLPRASRPGETLDDLARRVLSGLVELPGVLRAGLSLVEGGGRRLRFVSTDQLEAAPLDWCHIDAYEDVPLTKVVRTGRPIVDGRDDLDRRYDAFVARQPEDVCGIAALPLLVGVSVVGGLLLHLDERWHLDAGQRRQLDDLAADAGRALSGLRTGATRGPAGDDRAGRLVLEDDPRSVSLARRWLREFLAERDAPEDLVDTAQLCLSELATNAVTHAGGSFELRATWAAGVLSVMVRDSGSEDGEAPELDVDADPLRVYGRGLQLVGALADRWGSERDDVGSTVWFDLEAE